MVRIMGKTLAVIFCTVFFSGCGGGTADSGSNEKTDQLDSALLQEVVNMPNYLTVRGEHGVVQIGTDFFNLQLVQKGSVYIPASAPDMQFVSVTVTAVSPVMCIRPVTKPVALIKVVRNGSQFTYTFGSWQVSGQVAENIPWYVFDRAPVNAEKGALMIRNPANNELVFNSNFPVMKIAGIADLPSGNLTAQSAVLDTGIAGAYAACISQGRIEHTSQSKGLGQGFNGQLWAEGVMVNATGVVTSAVLRQRDGSGIKYASPPGGQLMLVDVAGL